MDHPKDDLCNNAGQIHENSETTPEKIYVSPAQIYFAENEILINVNDRLICTDSIHVDNVGYYFESSQAIDEKSLSWRCGECGKRNEDYYNYCKKCGHPRE